jgi:hypothetical protein
VASQSSRPNHAHESVEPTVEGRVVVVVVALTVVLVALILSMLYALGVTVDFPLIPA